MIDLVGLIVGYPRAYREDGAQRTIWSRVKGEHRNDPRYLIVEDIHTGAASLVFRPVIHTIMSESY